MKTAWAIIALVSLTAVPATGFAEGPTTGTCDDTSLIACAGLDAAGAVNCVLNGATPSCSWSVGNIWTAYSPVGMYGDMTASWVDAVEVCLDTFCNTLTSTGAATPCVFVAVLTCDGDQVKADTVVFAPLEVGQCAKVTVTRTGTIHATTELASVQWSSTGGDAGSVCSFNNGRD